MTTLCCFWGHAGGDGHDDAGLRHATINLAYESNRDQAHDYDYDNDSSDQLVNIRNSESGNDDDAGHAEDIGKWQS